VEVEECFIKRMTDRRGGMYQEGNKGTGPLRLLIRLQRQRGVSLQSTRSG
jgi:hypothetical protein